MSISEAVILLGAIVAIGATVAGGLTWMRTSGRGDGKMEQRLLSVEETIGLHRKSHKEHYVHSNDLERHVTPRERKDIDRRFDDMCERFDGIEKRMDETSKDVKELLRRSVQQ